MRLRTTQKGITLLVTMIFLILMSLFAASAFRSSTGNLKIIGNMQSRQESLAVGQQAIENTISSSLFFTNPTLVASTPVKVDIDGRGTATYTATLSPKPSCNRIIPIKNNALNPTLDKDLLCMKSAIIQQGGVNNPNQIVASGNSLCVESEWNISAEVIDARSGTKIVVNQGVAVRQLEADAVSYCN